MDTEGRTRTDQPEKFDLRSLDVAEQRREDLLNAVQIFKAMGVTSFKTV